MRDPQKVTSRAWLTALEHTYLPGARWNTSSHPLDVAIQQMISSTHPAGGPVGYHLNRRLHQTHTE